MFLNRTSIINMAFSPLHPAIGFPVLFLFGPPLGPAAELCASSPAIDRFSALRGAGWLSESGKPELRTPRLTFNELLMGRLWGTIEQVILVEMYVSKQIVDSSSGKYSSHKPPSCFTLGYIPTYTPQFGISYISLCNNQKIKIDKIDIKNRRWLKRTMKSAANIAPLMDPGNKASML